MLRAVAGFGLAVGRGAKFPALGLYAAAEDAGQIDKRLSASAKYLASDELEGRGLGTKGLDDAANYLAEQFRKAAA